MADRKVTVEVKFKLLLRVSEGIEVSEVMDELGYGFTENSGGADIEDEEMLDYEIKDSR